MHLFCLALFQNSIKKTRDSPLRPLLIQHPMSTIRAANRIPLLEPHLLGTVPTEILRHGTAVVLRGAESGAAGCGLLRGGGGGDVGFAGCHFWGGVDRRGML